MENITLPNGSEADLVPGLPPFGFFTALSVAMPTAFLVRLVYLYLQPPKKTIKSANQTPKKRKRKAHRGRRHSKTVEAEKERAEENKAKENKAEENKVEENKNEVVKPEEDTAKEIMADEIKAEDEKAEDMKAEEIKTKEIEGEGEKADEKKTKEEIHHSGGLPNSRTAYMEQWNFDPDEELKKTLEESKGWTQVVKKRKAKTVEEEESPEESVKDVSEESTQVYSEYKGDEYWGTDPDESQTELHKVT